MQKEMTRKQLMAACRAADRQQRIDRKVEIARLAKAMTQASSDMLPWELEDTKRLVYGAVGRSVIER